MKPLPSNGHTAIVQAVMDSVSLGLLKTFMTRRWNNSSIRGFIFFADVCHIAC